MKQKRYSEEQVIEILKQHEAGTEIRTKLLNIHWFATLGEVRHRA